MDYSSGSSSKFYPNAKVTESPPILNEAGEIKHFLRPLDRELCPNFFPRPRFTEYLNQYFPRLDRCHGALYKRVVLWGLAGSGKRQIAIQFALEHVKSTHQTILWLEAESIESFVRDYRNAFVTLTGLPVPTDLPLPQLLVKIQRTLEERYLEWFLVLLDTHTSMESTASNSFGLKLINYLPERGHILITTSCIIIEMEKTSARCESITCAINLIDGDSDIFVDDMTDDEAYRYIKLQNPTAGELSLSSSRLNDTMGFWPLRLKLSCANIRAMGLTNAQYVAYFSKTFGSMSNPKDLQQIRTMSPGFSITMNTAWEIVNDLDRAAVDLLVAISVVGPSDIPIQLLRMLSPFEKAVDDRLSRAIDFLSSMSLIVVRNMGNASETISMHNLIHRLLCLKIPAIYSEQYSTFVSDWLSVLSKYLNAEDAIEQPAKFWDVLPHFCQFIVTANKVGIKSLSFAAFLENVALFLVTDGLFHHVADIFVSQALAILRMYPGRIRRIEYALMKETLVRARIGLSKFRSAELEVRDALIRLERSTADEISKVPVRQRLCDLQIEILIKLSRHREACSVVLKQFKSASSDELRTARLHFNLAQCLEPLYMTSATIRHSHMAVSYWHSRPDLRDDPEMWTWVEQHADFMWIFQKLKGSLKLLNDLFERFFQHYPIAFPQVWRIAYGRVRAYEKLGMVEEAEELVIRMLSRTLAQDLSGATLTFCLLMLNKYAQILDKVGRLVEAGAIYRYNIHIASSKSVFDISGQSPYDYSDDRLNLIENLAEQGQFSEIEFYKDHYRQLGFDKDLSNYVEDSVESHKESCNLYQTAYEAMRCGDLMELHLNRHIDQKTTLERLERRFGSLAQRIEEGRDPQEDLDLTGLRMALRSRVLNLLDFNLVHLRCADREGTGFFCLPEKQAIIGQYFHWCECRRFRKRSGSIHPMDLIDKTFQVQNDTPSPQTSRYKQTLLDDWLKVMETDSKTTGLIVPVKDSSRSATPRKKSRFGGGVEVSNGYGIVRDARVQPGLISWDDDEIRLDYDEERRCLTWRPPSMLHGDHEEENYFVQNATNLPDIFIYPPPCEDGENPLADNWLWIYFVLGKKMTDYFPIVRQRRQSLADD